MHRSGLNMIVLATSAILLNACVTKSSSICPPAREYTAEFQDALAEEVVRYGDDFPLTVEVLSDYAVLRSQVRACP
jgi:hypothetical protein